MIPEQKCPQCEHLMQSSTGISKILHPKPGSISICLFCQAVLVFDDNLMLRKPTTEELAEFQSEPQTWASIQFGIKAAKTIRERQIANSN